MENNEKIGSATIKELFKKKLVIPQYQRPYAWEKEQVEDLIEDLIEAFDNKKDKYLIGNMIFHKEEEKINIVDGQQRTITLALILNTICQNNNECELEFLKQEINPLSIKNIQNNNKIIQNKLKNFSKNLEFASFILDKTMATYITAQDLDEAFMLFDSQNTRGKPLDRKDLLKVHHIRFIKLYDKQKQVAKKWEDITKNLNNNPIDNVDFVLNNLMLIRKAIRQELIGEDLVYLDVFKEFTAEDDEEILNNYNQPPIFEKFDFDIEKNELSLISKSFIQKGLFKIDDGLEFLPFEIIQSIEGGERFFWFVLKYFKLVEKLKKQDIFNALDNISGNGNIFLKKIYQSSLILFVDKFGFNDLKPFAVRIFTLLLAKRMNDSIRKEGVVKFEWTDGNRLDIFKLIFLKYSPNIIHKELNKYIAFNVSEINKPISGTKKEFCDAFKKYEDELKKILGNKYVQ